MLLTFILGYVEYAEILFLNINFYIWQYHWEFKNNTGANDVVAWQH